MKRIIRLAIVEDNDEIRDSLCAFLHAQTDMLCPFSCNSVESLMRMLTPDNAPDVVLMDIGLPGMSGIDGIRLIREKYPDTDLIMLTVYDDAHRVFESLCSGASGYLLKNTPLEQIREGIVNLRNGGAPMSPQIARKVIEHFSPKRPAAQVSSPLSDREQEIVIGLVDGLSYKLIASRMSISIETVRFHIKNIYRKLHVNCKAEVISRSIRGEI